MSDSNRNDRLGPERIDELLLERALHGLPEADERALGAARDSREALEYELGAATVALALGAEQLQPMPELLRAKLQAGAKAYFAERAADASAASRRESAPAPLRLVREDEKADARPNGWLSNAGWLFAAAAAVLALIAWWPSKPWSSGNAPTLSNTLARAELLARPDARTIAAKGQEQLAPGASGDIVWSNESQAGFIRLVGAPVNDPKVQQYQLWIFDEAQEHPVDGGVFDVTASGEVLIPIDAKLRVTKPTLFAITLEKPGGVVVSDRQRIAIVAAL